MSKSPSTWRWSPNIMDIDKLVKYIDQGSFCNKFDFDQIGQTWGSSYIRIVVGKSSEFESKKQFFISCFKVENNLSSQMQGGETWEECSDLKNWSRGLSVTKITSDTVLQFIRSSLKEHKRYNHDMVIDSNSLELPEYFENSWLIKETIDERHFINTTEFYFGVNENTYVLAEGHWES